jgi:hypothetical protein
MIKHWIQVFASLAALRMGILVLVTLPQTIFLCLPSLQTPALSLRLKAPTLA